MEYRTEGIEIPIGVIYLLCDPRQDEFNANVLEHSREFEGIVWKQIIERFPQAEILGGVRLAPINLFGFDFANLGNPEQAFSYFLSPEPDSYPTFVYRCPHGHNILVRHNSISDCLSFERNKDYYVGCMGSFKVGIENFPFTNISVDYKKVAVYLGKQMADDFINNIGLTKQDYIAFSRSQNISVVEAKDRILEMMWEGEKDLLNLEDREPLASYFTTSIHRALESEKSPDGFLSQYFKCLEYHEKSAKRQVTLSGEVPIMFRMFIENHRRLLLALKVFFDEDWSCKGIINPSSSKASHQNIPQYRMRPAEDLLDKNFCSALYHSKEASALLRTIVGEKIKAEACGRAPKNSENWTWAHVRRAMVRCGFFGDCPDNKTQEYWEDNAISDKDFGHAINSCDNTITPGSVKTQCINNKNKKEICDQNIVSRICEYLQPVVNMISDTTDAAK